MYYGNAFLPPCELGKANARCFEQELMLDMLSICCFHLRWAEEMVPDIMGSLFNMKDQFLKKVHETTYHINSCNSSFFWESERNIDFIYYFLQRKYTIDGEKSKELIKWIKFFEKDKKEAALNFWYEIQKGITESWDKIQC